jgi:uncharacterized protein YqfB (UPF0267 family)
MSSRDVRIVRSRPKWITSVDNRMCRASCKKTYKCVTRQQRMGEQSTSFYVARRQYVNRNIYRISFAIKKLTSSYSDKNEEHWWQYLLMLADYARVRTDNQSRSRNNYYPAKALKVIQTENVHVAINIQQVTSMHLINFSGHTFQFENVRLPQTKKLNEVPLCLILL